MNNGQATSWHGWLTGICVAGAIGLLLLLLQYNGFWVDEAYTLHAIRLGWGEMVMERLNRGHFPGYFAMVRLWYGLWPESQFELALRSFSVAFYLGALGSFWLLARRVLRNPAALVAVALFACNGVALRQAGEARMYTVVLLIAVWMIRAWFELQRPGSNKLWSVLLVALTVAGFAVSATIGVLIGSMILVSCMWGTRRLRWTLVLALVFGLAVFIPGAILHVKTAVRLGISSSKPLVFLSHPVALMPGVQIWDDYFKSSWQLYTLLVLGIPVTLYAIITVIRQRRTMPAELRSMAAISALPLVAITLSYPLVELYQLDIMGPPRYFISLMPMAALVGGWALMQLPRRVTVHAGLTVFLLLNAAAILTVRVEKFRPTMVEYLKPLYKAGDGLVVTVNEASDAVELYVPGSKVDLAVSRWEMDRQKLQDMLKPLSAKQVVWIVWYRGAKSPLIEVATEMWGKPLSNRPDKDKGSLFVYKFEPGKTAGQTNP